ncbi:hypothetical protein [Chitinophaga sp. HK235]|uniref:hypothetical protein n=1 Tax=Chitinophaga sp. HK235 TaxID=2952571 RepID=UPI001BADCD6F|nr:hypothetical protein [Chitinophaga sp. HK235]
MKASSTYIPIIDTDWAQKKSTRRSYPNELWTTPKVRTDVDNTSLTDQYLSIGYQLKELGFDFEAKELPILTDFLLANYQVWQELEKVPSVIPAYFSEYRLLITLYKDPQEGYCLLNLYIINSLDPVSAYQKEKAFFRNYFRPIYKKLKGKLNIKETSENL